MDTLLPYTTLFRSVDIAADAVAVRQRVDPADVAMHLDGLAGGDDVDIVEAAQLALQHFVGAQLVVELDQGDVGDDAGQVDGRLHARVAAADHRHALALEQRAAAGLNRESRVKGKRGAVRGE